MTRSKLSGPEKQEIAALFEHQQESIASLAERYQVSSSTIRRLLKNLTVTAAKSASAAQAEEAETALQMQEPVVVPETAAAKPRPIPKSSRSLEISAVEEVSAPPDFTPQEQSLPESLEISAQLPTSQPFEDSQAFTPSPRSSSHRPIRRSQLIKKASEQALDDSFSADHLHESGTAPSAPKSISTGKLRVDDSDSDSMPVQGSGSEEELSEILQEIGHDPNQGFAERLDEDEDDDDDFDDLGYDADDDSADSEGFSLGDGIQLKSDIQIEVKPFAEAVLPKTCYLVIDRTAELVTRPLRDFGELGQIPEAEIQSRTLPIFDNHRIARRFSHRNQRIIKVPDADMLKKTSTQLSAKGITRLLVNGHIYAL